MVFHLGLRDNKSSQVSRTNLSILTDLNNDVVWIVLILPPIFNFSRPLTKPLETVSSLPTTLGIIVALFYVSLFS